MARKKTKNKSDLMIKNKSTETDRTEDILKTMSGHDHEIEATTKNIITPQSLQSDYRFIEEIGHGSQGKIFKACRLADKKMVVVKQLIITSIKTWKEYELFHREAQILQTLNIDGVAKFYDAIDCLDDDPAASYIVQEYIPGDSLRSLIQRGHRFQQSDVYDILIQTLEILKRLHHHEPPVIHRDIKPSNLMITMGQKCKVTIIDFGAVANPQVQGGGSTIAGTYGYMAPEQLMGRPVPGSDIYSLAALTVELFTGQSPAYLPVKDFYLIFEPEMQDKPYALVSLIRNMLNPNAEQRLTDIDEIIHQFKKFRQNVFDESNPISQSDSAYSDLLEQRFMTVSYFGAPGNIEIWQQLPDDKRTIPKAYTNHKTQPLPEDLIDEKDLTNPTFWQKYKHTIKFTIFTIILLLVFIIFVAATKMTGFQIKRQELSETARPVTICATILLYIILYTAYNFASKPTIKYFRFEAIFILICTLLIAFASVYQVEQYGLFASVILVIIYLFSISLINSKDLLTANDPRPVLPVKESTTDQTVTPYFSKLFTNSRKTIASIVDIKYIPSDESNITYTDEKQKKSARSSVVYASLHKKPKFKILYKFNPPDDIRSEDIYHSFITHTDPEGHYKIGDTFPILYSIDDSMMIEQVRSMPFPVPIEDMSMDELVDFSDALANIEVNIADKIKQICNNIGYHYSANNQESRLNQISLLNFNHPSYRGLYHTDQIIKVNTITYRIIKRLLDSDSSSDVKNKCLETLYDMAFPDKPETSLNQPIQDILQFVCSKFHGLKPAIVNVLKNNPDIAPNKGILKYLVSRDDDFWQYNIPQKVLFFAGAYLDQAYIVRYSIISNAKQHSDALYLSLYAFNKFKPDYKEYGNRVGFNKKFITEFMHQFRKNLTEIDSYLQLIVLYLQLRQNDINNHYLYSDDYFLFSLFETLTKDYTASIRQNIDDIISNHDLFLDAIVSYYRDSSIYDEAIRALSIAPKPILVKLSQSLDATKKARINKTLKKLDTSL